MRTESQRSSTNRYKKLKRRFHIRSNVSQTMYTCCRVKQNLPGLLNDHERARSALQAAFDRNKRSPFIATRLASVYKRQGRIEDAIEVLELALSANPINGRLNFTYARTLREAKRDHVDTMIHHLRNSFLPLDRNYEAQFWYACYLFMEGSQQSIAASKEVFQKLRSAPDSIRHKDACPPAIQIGGWQSKGFRRFHKASRNVLWLDYSRWSWR